jgi:hypothetical protein
MNNARRIVRFPEKSSVSAFRVAVCRWGYLAGKPMLEIAPCRVE